MPDMPSQELLLKLFGYDPETGKLMWLWHPNARTRSIVVGSEAGVDNGSGYLVTKFKGQMLLVHRVIYKMLHDIEPPKVDHCDTDRSNNRPDNLRAADAVTNTWNRKPNAWKSLPKGVFENRPGEFRARITVRGERISLGTFRTVEEAQFAYQAGALEHFGEFANA